jgi:hypothetical protein
MEEHPINSTSPAITMPILPARDIAGSLIFVSLVARQGIRKQHRPDVTIPYCPAACPALPQENAQNFITLQEMDGATTRQVWHPALAITARLLL